ncbi:MAG: TIGR04086 family membrane protein [Ruminococcaceae bacterium]|nr:TIGR04086 family membrane protein [Oscillospiraceae bacterium]
MTGGCFMRKKEVYGRQEIITRVKLSVVMSFLSIVITVMILFLFSLLIEKESLPPEASEVVSEVVIIIMTLVSALLAVNKLEGKTLISGLSISIITVLLLLTGSLFFKGSRDISIAIIGGCLAAGAAAGIIGGRKRKIK